MAVTLTDTLTDAYGNVRQYVNVSVSLVNQSGVVQGPWTAQTDPTGTYTLSVPLPGDDQSLLVNIDGSAPFYVNPASSGSYTTHTLTGSAPVPAAANGSHVTTYGSGVPAIGGIAGDVYFRTDTPGTVGQRIYMCSASGPAGVATWVATAA